MPSRVIRDGLIDSETVSALHDRTFRLYVHLILTADDYGLVAVGYGPIKRAAPLIDWSREIIAKMLGELTDAGLILPYSVDGKEYAAIARWKTAINCLSPKYPIPSFGMTHVIGASWYKSDAVRKAASKYLSHISQLNSDSGTPAPNEGTASKGLVKEGLRDKEIKHSADTINGVRYK